MEAFLESIAAAGGSDLLAEVDKELRMGWNREQVQTEVAEARMSAACSTLESAAHEGTGLRVTADIPASSYFYWIHRGREVFNEPNIWRHEEFRKDYLKKNPQDRVRYRPTTAKVGWRSVSGSRVPVFGSQFPVSGSGKVSGSRVPVSGSRLPVSGSQFPVSGSKGSGSVVLTDRRGGVVR